MAPVVCVLAEGFWWHTCAVPRVPDRARGGEKVGISLPTCCWGLGVPSASGSHVCPHVSSGASAVRVSGLCRWGCGAQPGLISTDVSRALHFQGAHIMPTFFSLSLQALWKTGSRGAWSHCPCPVQDRRVAKSEDRSGPGSLPLPAECVVVQAGSWLWRECSPWSLVGRSPEPERPRSEQGREQTRGHRSRWVPVSRRGCFITGHGRALAWSLAHPGAVGPSQESSG